MFVPTLGFAAVLIAGHVDMQVVRRLEHIAQSRALG